MTGADLAILFDAPLPNRYAATLQFVRTAAAMAEGGRRCALLHAGRPARPEHALAALGASPHPNLALVPFFAPPRWPRAARWALLGRRLRALALASPGAVLSRGETAAAVLPGLAARRDRGRGPALVHEVHRLAGLSLEEARLGRSVEPAAALGARAARAHARDLAAARAADGVVFLTEEVRRAAAESGFPDRPSLVLPSGTDSPPPPGGARDLEVVYAGKLEARKGLPDLFAAMRALPHRRLDVAGGGVGELADARARAPGNVRLHGWLDQDKLSRLLARARVGACLLPRGMDSVSDRFTSPMKLLQMMAHGLGVVATDTIAVRAVATDGVDAILVAPNDPRAAAAAIERLLGDPAACERLGRAARRTAARYAWAGRARSLGAFVDSLADGRRRAGGSAGARPERRNGDGSAGSRRSAALPCEPGGGTIGARHTRRWRGTDGWAR